MTSFEESRTHTSTTEGKGTKAPESVSALEPGTFVGRFKVLRRLARGGMGEVYAARDATLGRKVALKLVRAERVLTNERTHRLRVEARTTASFSHPNIVTVYDVGTHHGRPYVALEHVEGQTLGERARAGALGVGESARIGLAIARALGEAHRHQVLHRDLKPDNVMIGSDGRVRVLDFGLARPFDRDAAAAADPQLGREGSGTPSYMAPEQWSGGSLTAAIDVWALGLILYELASARHPYADLDHEELRRAVTSSDPVPPLEGSVPAALRALIDACLAKDPLERPEVAAIERSLEDIVASGGATLEQERRPPFRGLRPCDDADARCFFGREAEIVVTLERLRQEPITTIVGPSGVGKSSFVSAGVIPRLRERGRWIVIKLRPGRDPIKNLASRLLDATPSSSSKGQPVPPSPRQPARELAASLRAEPSRLALWLERVADSAGARVLLFVDQLEELSTQCQDDAERRAFVRALSAAGDDPEGPIRVVATLRDDFLGVLATPGSGRALVDSVTILRPLDPEALANVLRRLIQSYGYRFDPPGLIEDIVAGVAAEQAALPLLQVTGDMLWQRRDRDSKVISGQAYHALGGVAGALARHADGVLVGLSDERVRITRTLLLRLVAVDHGGRRRAVRRAVTRDELLAGLPVEAAAVLSKLVADRLVVPRRAPVEGADEVGSKAGDIELEIVHESLIATWERLSRWIDESAAELVFVRQISEVAARWSKGGERDRDLLHGEDLHEALGKAAAADLLPPVVRTFLDAARLADRRRRRRRLMMLVATITALLLVAAGFGWLALEAGAQRDEAQLQEQLAAEHRAEVEELMDFMLEDLREKLSPLGRLPLLAMPATKAQAYYQRRPIDWSRPDDARRRALAHGNVGDVMLAQGDTVGALREYEASEAIFRRLAAETRPDIERRRDLAVSRMRVAEALERAGEVSRAVAANREALTVWTELVEAKPIDPALRSELVESQSRLGRTLLSHGKQREALRYLEASLEHLEGLVDEDPSKLEWRHALARTHRLIGVTRRDLGDLETAEEHIGLAADILAELARSGPDRDAPEAYLSATYISLVGLALRRGDPAAAREHAEIALHLAQGLVAKDPTNAAWQNSLAAAHAATGSALTALGDSRAAQPHFTRCHELSAAFATTPNDFYNAACCAALAGDDDRAFEMLDAFVGQGNTNTAWMEQDPDLEALRADPRWPRLIARTKGEAPAAPR